MHGRVIAAYLNSAPDPQSGRGIPADAMGRVLPWATGLARWNIEGVIFHDCLSERFCRACVQRSGADLKFVAVDRQTRYAPNDYRFLAYLSWLASNPCEAVFLTDLFDVRINRDPFTIMSNLHQLWVSVEPYTIDGKTPEGQWMIDRLTEAYGHLPCTLQDKPILNVGVWGGWYAAVLRALKLITCEIVARAQRTQMCADMAAFNLVIRTQFTDEELWISGPPLHSAFKEYEHNADVCFVHK